MKLDAGNTAWIITSAALVMLMTPGLAFFYGGLVRSKSVLNMLMMNFVCLAVVTPLWILYGYSMVFGDAHLGDKTASTDGGTFGGFIGWTSDFVGMGKPAFADGLTGAGVPFYVFAMFQLMFAVITPALISGAIADRTKFWGWAAFVALWVTICYFPVANWVFGTGWILNKLRAEDFAGGTAVHINAGAAALALAIVLGKRVGWRRDPMKPHNVSYVLLGASLLWFGWYGFNAGSEGAADGIAGLAFATTTGATATAVLGWLLVEQLRDGKPTTVGAASGAVAGLVAITPACGFVTPVGGMGIGLLAGVVCAMAVGLKYRFGFDDSLDVVGVHLVGGLVGTLSIGFFGFDGGTAAGFVEAKRGLFYGGDLKLLLVQAVAAGTVLVYSFVVAFVLGSIIKALGGFRISEEDEVTGIDETQHAETAYSFSSAIGGGSLTGMAAGPASSTAPPSSTSSTPSAPSTPVGSGRGV